MTRPRAELHVCLPEEDDLEPFGVVELDELIPNDPKTDDSDPDFVKFLGPAEAIRIRDALNESLEAVGWAILHETRRLEEEP